MPMWTREIDKINNAGFATTEDVTTTWIFRISAKIIDNFLYLLWFSARFFWRWAWESGSTTQPK